MAGVSDQILLVSAWHRLRKEPTSGIVDQLYKPLQIGLYGKKIPLVSQQTGFGVYRRAANPFAGGKIVSQMASARGEAGWDSLGNTYINAKEMWKVEAGEDEMEENSSSNNKRNEWYSKGIQYWQGVEASVDGVLGGYGTVSDTDVAESSDFIQEVCADRLAARERGEGKLIALDCGAGVGRVAKNLLLRFFNEVDLVEPLEHFLNAAREDLAKDMVADEEHRAVNFFCKPLEEFTPEAGRYDVIWVQWCIGHLTDRDFVDFFKRCKAGLKPGGFFFLKENIASTGFVVDKDDSSVTRSDALYRELFKRAEVHLLKTKLQQDFPKELFQVRMYALAPEPRPASAAATVAHQTRSKKRQRPKNEPGMIA